MKADVSHPHRINICHPAYAPGDDVLLELSALDHPEGGIHHGFALSLCAIIANNCDGYLTTTRYGNRIEVGFDDVLKAEHDYYYHIPHPGECVNGRRFWRASSVLTSAQAGEPIEQIDHSTIVPYKWPIVPTFQDWKFPNTTPEVWTRWHNSSRPQILPFSTASQWNYTSTVRIRDVSCRITQHYTGTEVAHLCPESERNWFIANNMQQYRANLNSDFAHLLKGPGNMFLIRSDLHKSFDDRLFVFFPKGPQGSLVLHTLQQVPDLSQIYHNVQLHPIPHCCPEFLLTRFAWSIFPLLTDFFYRRVPRYVVTVEETGKRTAREVFDTKELQDRAAKSRSRSLKKRMRAGDDELADNDGLASYDGSASPQSSANKHSTDENQPPKRQKRKSYNSSSSLEVPTSPPHLKNGFEWYPGSTHFDMLREQALALQRPFNFHNEQKGGEMSLREQLEDLGFEILDDSDGPSVTFQDA
jgi:hypothetical protein